MFILNILICLAISIISILKSKYLYNYALGFSFIIFFYSIIILNQIQPNIANFIENNVKMDTYFNTGLNFTIGLDGISQLFIILSTLLIVVSILTATTIKYRKRLFFILLFLTELALINVFAVTEIIYFYIFFEAVLIPMFLIIGIYGSRQEKISAAYHFFLYTLLGSLFMLLSIISIQLYLGSTNITLLKTYELPNNIEYLIWLAFFASFSVKIPMFPFHLWLPKAHVEAPTAGSVLLAGILLKLGSYGFVRFSLFLFPKATEFFRPIIIILALLGIIYSSFTILRQIDLKRIIAYSSVSHMSFVILGCFGGTIISLQGAFLLMLAHGLVSGGLFLIVGFLYDRYKSRNLLYYRGLINIMPIYAIITLLLLLANLGFPPTLNFISELLIITGLMEINLPAAFLSATGILFAGISGFWIFTRIFFGNYASTYGYYNLKYFYDITRREFYTLLPLLFLTILIGFNPNLLINPTYIQFACWGY